MNEEHAKKKEIRKKSLIKQISEGICGHCRKPRGDHSKKNLLRCLYTSDYNLYHAILKIKELEEQVKIKEKEAEKLAKKLKTFKKPDEHFNKIYNSSLDYTYYLIQIADEDVNVIAPFKHQGDLCVQNERFGLIRWGSQVDLVLPLTEDFTFELLLENEMHINAGVDRLVKINFPE